MTVVAVDGGKSATRIRVHNGGQGPGVDLTCPGFTHSPGQSIHHGWDHLATAISSHVGQPIDTIALGLTSLPGDPAEARFLAEGLGRRTKARHVLLCSDPVPAHVDTAEGEGILASVGTGSIVIGHSEDSGWVQVDGWGPLLGDRGSGIDLGQAGARAALAALDGIGPRTTLTGLLEHHLGGLELAVLQDFMSSPHQVEVLTRFAHHVGTSADAGDTVAQRVCHQAGEAIAASIAAVQSRCRLPRTCSIGLSGNVWASRTVRESVAAALQRPDLVTAPLADPLRGGLILARSVPPIYRSLVLDCEVTA